MSFAMTYHLATFVVILTTHEAITNGQCTVQGCDNGDQLISIFAEMIQQLRVDLFDQLNKQVQGIHELLNTSFQEMKSDHNTNNMSFQANDRCLQEREVHIEQGHRIHELLNESFQEMKNQLDTLNTSFQAIDRCPLERDICREQFQSMHDIFNESFQEIKSQHDTIVTSLQAVDRRLEEHDITVRNQTRNCFDEHETSIRNQTRNSIKEHDISSNNQTRDFPEEHDTSIRNQTQNSRTFANGSCDPASDVCDCSDIKASGQNRSGVYEVCVGQQLNRTCTSAFCDMETANVTSMVFQRRKDGSVLFNRTWAEYRAGFGNRNGEFWLGNEMLHLLTSKRNYKLRVDLEDWEGEKRFAEYANFSIGSPTNKYRLTVGNYSGNIGDSLNNHNGKQFSTIDADNDDSSVTNCAKTFGGGGWWYHTCFIANLNGMYRHRYETFSEYFGIHWLRWHNGSYSLKATDMKLVPVARHGMDKD